jgi:Uma2 family endonuclease
LQLKSAMNAPLNLKLDKQAFLKWAEGREGRYELKDHRIFMMTGASRHHWRVVSAFTALLRNLLDASSWGVGASDLAVEIGEDVRYPDVIVERASGDGATLFTSEPVAIVEVLSPSSLALDFDITRVHEPPLARSLRRRKPGRAAGVGLAAATRGERARVS